MRPGITSYNVCYTKLLRVNGIYLTDAPSQVEYLLADSDSVFVFVEDEEQLDKLIEVRERLPRLKRIIVFDMEGLRDFVV